MTKLDAKRPLIYPVILCGGAGTRLWPLSRASKPKQFLNLTGDGSLLQETVRRVGDRAFFAAPSIITGNAHRFLVAEQLRGIGVEPLRILLEPAPRNSAPAALAAALALVEINPEAILLLLAADHAMQKPEVFVDAALQAAEAAATGAIVTFGISPDRPHTGYGYVKMGEPLAAENPVHRVESFVEKPDLARAEAFLKEGSYLWNSGSFLAKASTLINEIERFEPEVLRAVRVAVKEAEDDLDFTRLQAEAFEASPSISIDYAVMERTEHAAVIPVDPGWSDIGSFASLGELLPEDANGNRVSDAEKVVSHDSADNALISNGPLIAALGIRGLTVVASDDTVLVADAGRGEEVKLLVEALKVKGHAAVESHAEVHRPWGHYRSLDQGPGFQVKQIHVIPGGRLSLQSHQHRAEHWVVVSGQATITRGETVEALETLVLERNQSVYIPLGWVHRLENLADEPLTLVEVQSGSYLGEDDIERYDDAYGRD